MGWVTFTERGGSTLFEDGGSLLAKGVGQFKRRLQFDEEKLQSLIDEKVTFRTFFEQAKIHPNEHMIKGVVCGYRIEEIEDEFELYKQCRQMEKLIDELAKGRKMEKILRQEKK
ncbi:MAG: DUF2200 family protein [Flavobacteriales bacterium]|nr:DUF2200 family protein [Flavobacteriales bacterium]